MKKIITMSLIALTLTISAYAKDFNIPAGTYSCEFVSINDANWKPIKYFTLENRKKNKTSFILDEEKIVDASGAVFSFNDTNSEGTNDFIGEHSLNAIYVPKETYKGNNQYFIGFGTMDNNKIVRMGMVCTKQ